MLFIIFVTQFTLLIHFKYIYRLLAALLLLVSCKSTKFVSNDHYLLKKNVVELDKGSINNDEIIEIIKQQANKRMIGMKVDLFIFNCIDSSKVAVKRNKDNIKIRLENQEKIIAQNSINARRIEKAREKNKTYYTQKTIQLKDTLEPNMFLKEWLKYKIGEEPVIFDSLLFNKSVEQIGSYLRKKGYYSSNVSGNVAYRKKKKAVVTYRIEPNERKMIDSVYVKSDNELVTGIYSNYIKKENNDLKGQPFDINNLDDFRYSVAREMKDYGLFDFSPSYIFYEADTSKTDNKVIIRIEFKDRMIALKSFNDSIIYKKHQQMLVKEVYFHILDSSLFVGDFAQMLNSNGLTLSTKNFPTLDTLVYQDIKQRKSNSVAINRTAYFLFNGQLFLTPKIIEAQNLLEKGSLWTEKKQEITHSRLLQLGLFQTIKIEINEIQDSNLLVVHYYLTPAKKESFSFEPRVTTSSGFLGVSAGMNYMNKNLFSNGEKLTFGLNTSIQAVPAIFESSGDYSNSKDAIEKFYQFEIGPSINLELPGLLLIKKPTTNKTRLAKTIFSTAYSFQQRTDFVKESFQINSTWKYEINNTQIVKMGLPGISVIKFINIQKSDNFESKLQTMNNPFYSNAFSNQFIWQDWTVSFEYRDKDKKNRKLKSSFYYLGAFDIAGSLLSAFKNFQVADTAGLYKGSYRVNGLVYAQFSKVDNTVIYSHPLGKYRSVNMRALVGMGMTYGNSKTSMPYDYSFFGGGSNDVRGWKAFSLGPGSYKYYLDTNGTNIQVGDLRLSGSAEYRFQITDFFKAAFFVDGGNIWTLREDPSRPGGKFSSNWHKEIAVAAGIGLRMDFDFFLVRFDFGFPLNNPALPNGEKWVFQKQHAYHQEIADMINSSPTLQQDASRLDSTPFSPHISFGIGYPF